MWPVQHSNGASAAAYRYYLDAERALVLAEAIKLLEDERRGFCGRLFVNSVQTESFPTLRPIWNATTAATSATIT